jgi:hypothetical protein
VLAVWSLLLILATFGWDVYFLLKQRSHERD